jgi:hypothetical protein
MKYKYRFFALCFLMVLCCSVYAQKKAKIKEEKEWVYLKNTKVQLGFNLNKGLFYLSNNNGEKVVDNAYFQAGGLQSKDACEKRTWSVEDVNDELGKGTALTIKVTFDNYADILWQVRLYDDKDYFIFNMGIDNDTPNPYHLMSFYPMVSKKVYAGKDNGLNYCVLDGNGGGTPTKVTDMESLRTFNNLLVKFGDVIQPNILVAGGITYNEFEKFVKVTRTKEALQIQLNSEDPVGKLIDPNQKYWLNEKFYLCFENQNPFEALEKYAVVLKGAQKIDLNYYDFPTECLWYANVYSHDKKRRKFNDSKGAVEEMDNAILSGITKYTKVAIRLVPDAYGPNNQQGWWDDEHWAKWGGEASADNANYIAPYLTTESWAQAIIKRGGFPFTYIQSGRRSEDFVKLHPDWMLFNNPYREVIAPQRFLQDLSYPSEFAEEYSRTWWSDKQLWSYDFTDTGFIKHLQKVYENLKKAGIKGIFYDYPEATAWAFEGGFDNKYATTAWAYRNMFKLAYEGLGKDALLQERNVTRGSDISLGLISSQRVWADASTFLPEMVSRCGLRWYKNRVVINYDMDSKDPESCIPNVNNDGARCMLTMCYVTSGRFLLAPSFNQLTKEQMYDLSRTFPYHTTPQSARPVDAFNAGVKYPKVYDFEINPNWHQLTFYNYELDSSPGEKNQIAVWLSKSLNEGGLALNAAKQYYIYDFWNNHFIGLFNGNDKLEQQLRAGEARMMSVHAKEEHPQFISTNRHIMQGYLDLKDVNWDKKQRTLSGTAEVIENEPFEIVIATNNYKVKEAKVLQGKVTVTQQNLAEGIVKLTILNATNAPIKWSLSFK